jgi:hypothetical protein
MQSLMRQDLVTQMTHPLSKLYEKLGIFQTREMKNGFFYTGKTEL